MSNTLIKNRIIIILLFAMTIIPFSIAWYMSVNTEWVAEGTNKGQLIDPVITADHADFTGLDQFSIDNLTERKGRWVLLNLIEQQECTERCLDALHKSKQLRLMMSKDLTRIRRMALLMHPNVSTEASTWWEDDIRLLRTLPSTALKSKISAAINGPLEGGLLLMDPLGNIMMWYGPEFNPYDVKADLAKLLKFSQVG